MKVMLIWLINMLLLLSGCTEEELVEHSAEYNIHTRVTTYDDGTEIYNGNGGDIPPPQTEVEINVRQTTD